MKVSIELGLISGDQKRCLECYLDSRHFTQRKTYDEYYVDAGLDMDMSLTINDLMIIAEDFSVAVLPGGISITNYPHNI